MNDQWIPVVSGAVGASGAVLAQVVAAFLTNRRERRASRVREAETSRALFRDERKELYARFLNLIFVQRDEFTALLDKSPGVALDTVRDAEWRGLLTEFNLLAPALQGLVSEAATKFRHVAYSLKIVDASMAKSLLSDINQVERRALAAMRTDLGLS